jgi:hypothetical protein
MQELQNLNALHGHEALVVQQITYVQQSKPGRGVRARRVDCTVSRLAKPLETTMARASKTPLIPEKAAPPGVVGWTPDEEKTPSALPPAEPASPRVAARRSHVAVLTPVWQAYARRSVRKVTE